VVVVMHDGDLPLAELITHLAKRTVLEIHEVDVESLQVVILWRTLVDVDGDA
jgi:hypothetical protein